MSFRKRGKNNGKGKQPQQQSQTQQASVSEIISESKLAPTLSSSSIQSDRTCVATSSDQQPIIQSTLTSVTSEELVHDQKQSSLEQPGFCLMLFFLFI